MQSCGCLPVGNGSVHRDDEEKKSNVKQQSMKRYSLKRGMFFRNFSFPDLFGNVMALIDPTMNDTGCSTGVKYE